MTDTLDPYPGNLRNHQVNKVDKVSNDFGWMKPDPPLPPEKTEVRIVRRIAQNEDGDDIDVLYPATVMHIGGERYVCKVNLNSYDMQELRETIDGIGLAMELPVVDEDSLDIRRK